MSKVLWDCIPEITVEDKDETIDDQECRKFVIDHIRDCEKVLPKLEEAKLTLSGGNSDL